MTVIADRGLLTKTQIEHDRKRFVVRSALRPAALRHRTVEEGPQSALNQ